MSLIPTTNLNIPASPFRRYASPRWCCHSISKPGRQGPLDPPILQPATRMGEQPPPNNQGSQPVDKLPQAGDVIHINGLSFKLDSVIGDGGYGQVFLSSDGTRKLAVKCEKYSRSMLHVEVNVLLHAAEQKCKHFCERVAHGSVGKEYVFIVMTLLGRDLHKARNEMKDRRFTLSTALRIGVHTLKGIEELHRLGFLSRDIKPGNFAPGLRENKQNKLIFLYDFGLARKYLDSNGNIVQPRPDVGWRGTTRYGSLTAHHRADLSRRDDLESWFYMLVEFTNGQLPWRTITDRGAVLLSKQAARTPIGLPTFLVNCPKQFPVLLKYIDELVFTSAPDYAHLLKILDEAREENNVKAYERWDWEDESLSSNSISQASSHSEREQKAKPEASPREVRNKK
ncbi:unnamed protein product, partial [Mesorhabditis spiculigera]